MSPRLVRVGTTDGGTPILRAEQGFKRCAVARKAASISPAHRTQGATTILAQLNMRGVRFRARSAPVGPCICPGCDRICDLPLDIAPGQEFEVWG